jgi:NTP pyrophosphatase (non-canonical NTP hydrolase)
VADWAEVQRRLWANKVRQGFNTTDVPLEFNLLHREVAEAFTAWLEDKPDYGGELADIMLFTFALAEMAGLDLGAEVEKKLIVNEGRVYTRLANGVPVRVRKDEES